MEDEIKNLEVELKYMSNEVDELKDRVKELEDKLATVFLFMIGMKGVLEDAELEEAEEGEEGEEESNLYECCGNCGCAHYGNDGWICCPPDEEQETALIKNMGTKLDNCPGWQGGGEQ